MTNKEKNKNMFDELGLGDLSDNEVAHRIAVKENGDVGLCVQTPCIDCIFCKGYWNCYKEKIKWLESEAEPDEPTSEKKEEKIEEDEIKVGDTVKVTRKDRIREGEIGTVRSIRRLSSGLNLYGVSFDRDGRGRAFLVREIEKVKVKKTPPRIVIYQNGDTVTAKDLKTGEKASAVCSKDDTFDFHTGAFIAMSRLAHFDRYIKCMQNEVKELDHYISDIKLGLDLLM